MLPHDAKMELYESVKHRGSRKAELITWATSDIASIPEEVKSLMDSKPTDSEKAAIIAQRLGVSASLAHVLLFKVGKEIRSRATQSQSQASAPAETGTPYQPSQDSETPVRPSLQRVTRSQAATRTDSTLKPGASFATTDTLIAQARGTDVLYREWNAFKPHWKR